MWVLSAFHYTLAYPWPSFYFDFASSTLPSHAIQSFACHLTSCTHFLRYKAWGRTLFSSAVFASNWQKNVYIFWSLPMRIKGMRRTKKSVWALIFATLGYVDAHKHRRQHRENEIDLRAGLEISHDNKLHIYVHLWDQSTVRGYLQANFLHNFVR